ncbi:MAG: nitronate monooxygenase [Eubacteriales bacterium]|nr:nitronate monooxygenase [Eubacteriales bacterium]
MKKLNEILGTEFPIIQGGMANIATGEFAAACANAGALGMIATGGWDGDRLRAEIRRARELTDKPIGVNLMLMSPYADDIAGVILEEKVGIVTTGAGNPGKYINDWKAAGIKVIPVVASAILAKRLCRYDIDAVIAEGTESGGHVGEMTTMALVPQVIDAVDVPVIAAGGIADGRQCAAAFALGACGIQIGTSLLASFECPIHDNYKQAILKAKDSDTVVTGRSIGGPVRILKNEMTRAYLELEKKGASLEELETLTLGGLRRAVLEGDVKKGSVMSGQVAGMLHELKPVRQIFEEIYNGSKEVLKSTEDEWC